MSLSLQTLPPELVYRILDHLDDYELFVSTNICQRLNDVLNSYSRYQVNKHKHHNNLRKADLISIFNKIILYFSIFHIEANIPLAVFQGYCR